MKKFIRHEYDDLGRIYVFDDGSRYYSVTTALGNTKDKRFLEEWRQRIGRQRAEALTKIACKTGTTMHEILEYYLKGEELIEKPNAYMRNLANQIIPYINKRVTRVHEVEAILHSNKMKLAGMVDAVVTYADKLCILDFKTSKRQPKPQWIQDYLLQLAIYALMIEEMTGYKIEYGCLLFAYKQVKSRNQEVFVKLAPYKELALKRINLFSQLSKKHQI